MLEGNDGIFLRCVKEDADEIMSFCFSSDCSNHMVARFKAFKIDIDHWKTFKSGIDHWRTKSHETQAGEHVSQGGTELMMRILQALQSREAFRINSPIVTTCNRLGQVLHIASAETSVQVTPF